MRKKTVDAQPSCTSLPLRLQTGRGVCYDRCRLLNEIRNRVDVEKWLGMPRARHIKGNEKMERHRGASYLALDVDAAEGGRPERVEELELIRFRSQKQDVTVPFLEDMLSDIVNDKLCRMLITLEAKLLSDEAQSHVWFVSTQQC